MKSKSNYLKWTKMSMVFIWIDLQWSMHKCNKIGRKTSRNIAISVPFSVCTECMLTDALTIEPSAIGQYVTFRVTFSSSSSLELIEFRVMRHFLNILLSQIFEFFRKFQCWNDRQRQTKNHLRNKLPLEQTDIHRETEGLAYKSTEIQNYVI